MLKVIKEYSMEMDYMELYERARKQGLKNFHAAYDKEKYYLSCLDDQLKNIRIVKEVNLGRKEILLKKIIGTKTNGRRTSFSSNFMPLLPLKSEFSDKWRKLCQIHIEEGVRDPIKVYEYLNKYYVQEGNKRVSVLKFFDAYSIQADVMRIIPEYDSNNLEICIYYSFLKFYKKTHVDYIWMSDKEHFNRLYVYIIKYSLITERFDDTEFRGIYYRFRKYYYEEKGNALNITTGDAFLKYLDIYQYEKNISDKDLKENVSKLMDEFKYLENPNQDMIFDDIAFVHKPLISSFKEKKTQGREVVVAFIYGSHPRESSWADVHDKGAKCLEEKYVDKVKVYTYYNALPEINNRTNAIQKAVDDEADLIFVTTPIMKDLSIKVAIERKETNIFLCTQKMVSKWINTYFARMFEVEFLAGMIAGTLSNSNALGYVLGEPIAATIANINAFALGARFMNPYAKVYVGWIRNMNEKMVDQMEEELNKLLDHQVDIISLPPTVSINSSSSSRGIYRLESKELLAEPVWNWGEFYIKILEAFLAGTLKSQTHLHKADFFWWGIDSKIIDIKYGETIPEELKETVDFMKKMISSGTYSLFTGPMRDNLGNVKLEEGEIIAVDDLLNMNWLVKGVEGEIPVIHVFEENSMLSKYEGVYKCYDL